MRITLTLLLVTSLGCQRQTETPSQTPSTTDSVATAPQAPAEPQFQHGTASGSHFEIADSALDNQAEQTAKAPPVDGNDSPPKNSGKSTKQGSDYDLAIVDENGNPIRHATVEPISPSINYEKFDTDENGHADIPWKLQPVKWIAITKSGYFDSGRIDVEQPKPIIITLKNAAD